jgi:hypothetical protein
LASRRPLLYKQLAITQEKDYAVYLCAYAGYDTSYLKKEAEQQQHQFYLSYGPIAFLSIIFCFSSFLVIIIPVRLHSVLCVELLTLVPKGNSRLLLTFEIDGL